MFAISYLNNLDIVNYFIFFLYADKKVREKRLIDFRNQPELVHDDMENWSNLLRKITYDLGGFVLDSSGFNPNDTAKILIDILESKLSLKIRAPLETPY